jgi:MFS family permease
MATNSTPETAAGRPAPPKVVRWMVLIFISFAMFGNYYIYDSISPLAKTLKDQLSFSDSEIGWLQGIYSLINVFMVLIGGLIIDRIGTRKATFLFASLCLVGAGITAAYPSFWVMLVGRLVFGLGAESLIVAVTTACAKWFRGKELSFAFGINLLIARLGSFLALNSLTWAKPLYENWQWPMFLSIAAGVVCVAGAVIYWILESAAERKYELGEGETEKIVLKDVFKFSKSYWLIVALCATFYSGVFPFQTFAIKLFVEARGTSPELAGFLSSLLTLFAMIFTPLFGLMVDRVGKRSLYMFFGSLILIPVYLMVAYLNISLFVPMALMGISFSLIPAVMWPSVAYIVEPKRLGTAYGLMTMIQNIGLFSFNVTIGWANDLAAAGPTNPGGYAVGMWIFSILGFVALFFSFMLWKAEKGPDAHGLETIKTEPPTGERRSYLSLVLVFIGAILVLGSTTFDATENDLFPEYNVSLSEISPLSRHEIVWPESELNGLTESEIHKAVYIKRAVLLRLGPSYLEDYADFVDESAVRQWKSYESISPLSYGMIFTVLPILIIIIHFFDAFTDSKFARTYMFRFSFLLFVLLLAAAGFLAYDLYKLGAAVGSGDALISGWGNTAVGTGLYVLGAGLLVTLFGFAVSPFRMKQAR